MGDFDLAALLCSRLCHDLVSPVGAIVNGSEILDIEDDEAIRNEALTLMSDSAAAASARLQYYRLAFGNAGPRTRSVNLAEARTLAVEYFDSGRITLNWPPLPIEIRIEAVKLLLNLILIAADGLVRGGTLEVAADKTRSGLKLAVTASGEGMKLSGESEAMLLGAGLDHDLDTRSAPAGLARNLARQSGGVLSVRRPAGNQLVLAVRYSRP